METQILFKDGVIMRFNTIQVVMMAIQEIVIAKQIQQRMHLLKMVS